jgi:ankyrin repeat protein
MKLIPHCVKMFMASPDRNQVGCQPYASLHYAAYNGDLVVIKTLLENDRVNVNQKCDLERKSPLFVAAQNGHLSVVKYLIYKGADLNAKTAAGWTPLFVAAHNGHLSVVEYLVKSMADVNVITKKGQTVLDAAASKSHDHVVKFFLENVPGIDTHSKLTRTCTPLSGVCKQGQVGVVRYLVNEVKGDTSATINSNVMPLYNAAQKGNREIVKLLIQHGAPIEVESSIPFTESIHLIHFFLMIRSPRFVRG